MSDTPGTGTSPAADLLGTIVAATRKTVAEREHREPLEQLARRAAGGRQPVLGRFRDALSRPGRYNVIAECKRRSPSRGVLRADYDPVAIASGYERAGAAACSVLTEPAFFDGSLEHLRAVRDAVAVPLIRKDFIVCEYQLHEAVAAGADAVLLIVSALNAEALAALHRQANALGLDVLVEVHSADELQMAIAAGAGIIGVNNRNLRTLTVDVHLSEVIASAMPAGIVAVSESGLRTAADLVRLRGMGYSAFLIGERFMTQTDPGAGLADLLAGAASA